MYQKRKRFKVEVSPERRLSDRWEQQVFFLKRKFPDSERAISAIVKSHESKQGAAFVPSEDALHDLANLCAGLGDPA